PRRDVPGRGPRGQVAAFDGGGHEVGEQVGSAGEGGDAEGGQGGGVVVVVGRGAGIAEGQEGDNLDAGGDEVGGPLQHLGPVTAFDKVADEHEHGLGRPGHGRLAVGQGLVDVGAAAELGAEQHVDRVVQVLGQVDDRR